jgi:hypothetical protein
MAFGALVGIMNDSQPVLSGAPATETPGHGAAGALAVLIAASTGFAVSLFTVILCTVLRRSPPARFLPRGVLAFLAGTAAGALAPNPEPFSVGLAWILLLGAPAALSWSYAGKTAKHGRNPS